MIKSCSCPTYCQLKPSTKNFLVIIYPKEKNLQLQLTNFSRDVNVVSKREKDWTRRVGNDRHLICIEDPFEISHDLGRVVDKYSIKVLREEFERAADIMQYDANPCVKLFEPYVPDV